jgi:hypothetical protein
MLQLTIRLMAAVTFKDVPVYNHATTSGTHWTVWECHKGGVDVVANRKSPSSHAQN